MKRVAMRCMHVQYFNKNGQLVKTCPFFMDWNKSIIIYNVGNQANKKYLASHSDRGRDVACRHVAIISREVACNVPI